jgi:hypothetical protein
MLPYLQEVPQLPRRFQSPAIPETEPARLYRTEALMQGALIKVSIYKIFTV